MVRTSAVLALIVSSAGASVRAAVVVPDNPQAGLKSVADRVHSTVIAVHAQAMVSVSPAGDGQAAVQTPTFGTGVLVGDGLAITTLHTVGLVAPGRFIAWSDIEVLLQDSGPVPARILGWFPELDLAVLRLA
jgi:S1-C subfamily serine protease